jgi:fructose-1,6-bisphosphatase/sedoheptulose 1,7-bisphosphatase-like protein
VFVDDAGAHVGDFGAFGELVDDEGIKLLVIGDGDVEQEVLAARDDEHADGVGEAGGPVAEGLDSAPGGWPDPH